MKKMHSAQATCRAGFKAAVLIAAALPAFAVQALQMDPLGVGKRKVILSGWEFSYLTPDDYLENIDAFAETPADGAVLYIQRNEEVGRDFFFRTTMTEPRWSMDKLSDLVGKYREMRKHPCLRHSFLSTMRVPVDRRLDWRDDAAWEIVANNMSVAATLARTVGFPGISIDVEDYSKRRQFQRIETDIPYVELKKLARRRGREVFKAVFEAYPDITVLGYFGMSALFFRITERDAAELAHAKRELLPSFLNGMLDAMPPTASFVEGCENAYRYDYSKKDFLATRTRIYNWYLPLVEPENRAKYLSQVKTAFGLYIDSYVNPETSVWYFSPVDGSRLEHLRRNFAEAFSATDEYVWIWGEKGRWADWNEKTMAHIHRGAKGGIWNDLVPGGLNSTIRKLKDPERYLLPAIEEAIASGRMVNMVSNPGFRTDVAGEPGMKRGRIPKPFGTWQATAKKGETQGVIGLDTSDGDGDRTCAFLKGTKNGCVTFECHDTSPGKRYYVTASVKGEGALPCMSFRTAANKWINPRNLLTAEIGGPDVWRKIRAIVTAPEGAKSFTVTLDANNLGPNEIVRYDNLCVYELPGEILK